MGNNPVGGLLNTYPVRPHLLRTEPCYCTTLLLEEGPALEGLGHSSSARRENTNTFLRKERAFFILLLRGAGHHLPEATWPEPALMGQCEAAHRPRCLPSIFTVNEQPAGAWVPAVGARHLLVGGDGTRETLRSEQLLVPAQKPSCGSRVGRRGGSGQEQLRAGARTKPHPAPLCCQVSRCSQRTNTSSREAKHSKKMNTRVHLQLNLLQGEKTLSVAKLKGQTQ